MDSVTITHLCLGLFTIVASGLSAFWLGGRKVGIIETKVDSLEVRSGELATQVENLRQGIKQDIQHLFDKLDETTKELRRSVDVHPCLQVAAISDFRARIEANSGRMASLEQWRLEMVSAVAELRTKRLIQEYHERTQEPKEQ